VSYALLADERAEIDHVTTIPIRPSNAWLLAAALLCLAPSTRGDEPSATTRAEIVSLTRELMDAIAPGKAEVWDRILADDATVVDEVGRREDKRQAVRDLKPLPSGFSGSIELRDPHVRQYGDTAVIDGEAYERESVFEQRLVVRYRFMATWVRRGGAWKLAAMQNLTVPTDPPALAVTGLRLDDYPGSYRYGPGRAYLVRRNGDGLSYSRRQGGKEEALRPVSVDVFTEGSDEKNLIVFQRDAAGRVERLIERRKYNDLHMNRE